MILYKINKKTKYIIIYLINLKKININIHNYKYIFQFLLSYFYHYFSLLISYLHSIKSYLFNLI